MGVSGGHRPHAHKKNMRVRVTRRPRPPKNCAALQNRFSVTAHHLTLSSARLFVYVPCPRRPPPRSRSSSAAHVAQHAYCSCDEPPRCWHGSPRLTHQTKVRKRNRIPLLPLIAALPLPCPTTGLHSGLTTRSRPVPTRAVSCAPPVAASLCSMCRRRLVTTPAATRAPSSTASPPFLLTSSRTCPRTRRPLPVLTVVFCPAVLFEAALSAHSWWRSAKL